MQAIFSQEELDFISLNYDKMTYKELSACLNKFNDIKKNEKQVRNRARNLGFGKRKYHFNKEFFKCIDSEIKAYWLGFIYADGYIVDNKTGYEVGIELQAGDANHLKKFNDHLSGNMLVNIFSKKSSEFNGYTLPIREMCSLRIYSKEVYYDLISQGVVNRKTLSPVFPRVSSNYMIPFIRGFFDGDGCLYFKDNRHKAISFTNANKEFLEYIQRFLNDTYSLTGRIYEENDRKYKLVYFNNNDFYTVLNELYDSAEVYLERKHKKYLILNKNNKTAV